MREITRTETAGLVGLLIIISGVVGWTSLHSVLSPTPIIFKQASAPVATPKGEGTPVSGSESMVSRGEKKEAISLPNSPSPTTTLPSPSNEIVVHVAGAVQKPGVYHLAMGARGEDALKAAGGPTKDANTDAINLAAHLEDGTQLHFPTHKEQPEDIAKPENVKTASASAPSSPTTPKSSHISSHNTTKGGERGSKPDKLTDPSQGKINLNTADAEQLQRLPGIGPSMAERILEYRKENGGFQSVEDLMQVSGVGEKKFAKMQPYVKVH